VTVDTAHMSCRELVELVTSYLDGPLTLEDRLRFEHHLAGCGHCTTYLEQMRRTIELTGTLRVEDVSPQAEATLLEVFRDWSGH
jgi:anti-sigma factor RsiW